MGYLDKILDSTFDFFKDLARTWQDIQDVERWVHKYISRCADVIWHGAILEVILLYNRLTFNAYIM